MKTPEKETSTCAQWEQHEAQALLVKTGLQKLLAFTSQKCWQVSVGLTCSNAEFAKALTEAFGAIFNRVGKDTFLMKKLCPSKCHGPSAESGASRTSVRKDKCF